MNRRLALALLAALAHASCASTLEPPPEQSFDALPSAAPHPDDNPPTPEKIELGRLLFWDPILSGGHDVACATCHHPHHAYADGRKLSVGVGGKGLGPARHPSATPHQTPRNSMTILDVAWNGVGARDPIAGPADAAMFWDSRARSLEAQAKMPILSLDEMRGEGLPEGAIFPEIVARLGGIEGYRQRFERAFGPDAISEDNIARAIAAFERTLTAKGSSFDRWMQGDDRALSFAQKRGMVTFVRAGCARCHSGPLFSDFRLHRLGVPDEAGAPHDAGDGHERFRTPSLRNVTRTAPYMHNGSIATLEGVLDFYFHVDTRLDPDLDGIDAPNNDGNAVTDLIDFLGSISDGEFDRSVPESVPSGLQVGGAI